MTYLITKPAGSSSIITLTNKDTGKSIILGRITIPILDILKEHAGLSLTFVDEWNIVTTEEVGKLLAHTALVRHKALKAKKDKPKEEVVTSQPSEQKKAPVDLFDLIYGTKI
jgi:hypothetical protein